MSVPNLVQPLWNKREVDSGAKYVYVPNDFHAYDELWAHVRVHGISGTPSAANLVVKWQIAHPQDGGGYTSTSLNWRDLEPTRNGHLFISGLDWPKFVSNGTDAAKWIDFVRGVRLGTGMVRLAFISTITGGTDPKYTISVSLFARSASGHTTAIPQPKVLTVENNNYNYIQDLWGYSLSNPTTDAVFVTFRNGSGAGDIIARAFVPGETTVTHEYPWPMRFSTGLYYAVSVTGKISQPIVYTTDNLDDTP